MLPSIEQRLALELSAKPAQVAAAVPLLDEGATVPFIARYRKEATGGLDDIQLRLLEERLRYLRELEERRAAVIASINEQDKMTPELLRRLRRWPKTRPGWKTCTCLTSKSAAPRPRSRSKPAWRRWPTPCWPTRRAIPRPKRPTTCARPSAMPMASPTRACRCQGGARRRAPDPDGALRRRRRPAAVAARIRAGPRRGRVESGRGQGGRRRKVRRLLRLFRNRWPPFPRTARWRCCAAAAKASWTSPCAWIRSRKSRSGMRRTTRAKAGSRHASASRRKAARPTSGCSTPRAGPGA